MHIRDDELIRAKDGELSARREAAVRDHLDGCARCRDRIRAFDDTFRHLTGAWRENEVGPADGPRAMLRARIREENSPAPGPIFWRQLGWAGAAFVLIVAAVPLLFEKTANGGQRPRASLTPGETHPVSLADVCRTDDAQVVVANIPEDTRRRVFAAYGVKPGAGEFEVDYLITPDLGGAESIRNMWPQPYSTKWNAKVKDRLEQRLHQLVCARRLDLATAQHDIAADWIAAYRKYLGEN